MSLVPIAAKGQIECGDGIPLENSLGSKRCFQARACSGENNECPLFFSDPTSYWAKRRQATNGSPLLYRRIDVLTVTSRGSSPESSDHTALVSRAEKGRGWKSCVVWRSSPSVFFSFPSPFPSLSPFPLFFFGTGARLALSPNLVWTSRVEQHPRICCLGESE